MHFLSLFSCKGATGRRRFHRLAEGRTVTPTPAPVKAVRHKTPMEGLSHRLGPDRTDSFEPRSLCASDICLSWSFRDDTTRTRLPNLETILLSFRAVKAVFAFFKVLRDCRPAPKVIHFVGIAYLTPPVAFLYTSRSLLEKETNRLCAEPEKQQIPSLGDSPSPDKSTRADHGRVLFYCPAPTPASRLHTHTISQRRLRLWTAV